MAKNKLISKNLFYIQVIFITTFIILMSLNYNLFVNTKKSFESFENEEAKLIKQVSDITNDISKFKNLIFIASLRKGDDFFEMEAIKKHLVIINKKIQTLKLFSDSLNDDFLKQIMKELNEKYIYFYKIGKDMPKEFKKSFEDGLDSLGAIDNLNSVLSNIIKKLNQHIVVRVNAKNNSLNEKLKNINSFIFTLGIIAIIISLIIYFRFFKLKKFNNFLDEIIQEKTKELNFNLAILKEYKSAIDKSVLVVRYNSFGEPTYANEKILKLFGFNLDEIKELFKLNIKNLNVSEVIYKVDKNGKTLFLQNSTNSILNNKNEIVEYISIMQDITKLEEIRLNKLSKSVDRALDINFETILNFIPIASAILDKNSKILFFNMEFKKLFFTKDLHSKDLNFNDIVTIGESLIDLIDWKEQIEESEAIKVDIDENISLNLKLKLVDREKKYYLISLF